MGLSEVICMPWQASTDGARTHGSACATERRGQAEEDPRKAKDGVRSVEREVQPAPPRAERRDPGARQRRYVYVFTDRIAISWLACWLTAPRAGDAHAMLIGSSRRWGVYTERCRVDSSPVRGSCRAVRCEIVLLCKKKAYEPDRDRLRQIRSRVSTRDTPTRNGDATCLSSDS